VSYATAPGSAAANIDYTTTTGTLTFTPGQTSKTIIVPVLGDTLDEANETYTVSLSAPTNATLGSPSTGTGTITDDDPSSSLRISDVTVAEGASGTVAAVFNVTLTPAAGRTATVNYATANGTATTGNGDYTATSGSLTFLPGETAKTVTVLVNGDVLDEADETFNVNLSGASAATIADSQGVATIVDDDPTPTVSIGDTSVVESNLLTTRTATFTLTLSAASNRTITVNYATANGTALAGLDYTAKSGTVTFNAGVITRTVTVTITGDNIKEANETFFVNLSSPSNVVISDGQGLGTIVDND
jgi:large repetitive protein